MRAKLWIAAVLVAATAAAAADAGLAAPSKTRRPFSEASRATLGSLQELDGAPLLVQLARGRQAAAAPLALRRAGARLVSETLRIWVVPASNAQRVVAPLIRGGAVVAVERNRTRRRAATPGFTDPLWPSEWWRAAVGADAAPLLPAGVPLTIVDSGVDLTHPEFQGAHITLLNQQFLGDASDDDHGTAVTSVAAAPANGFGMVGIYPNANVWEWDGRSYRDSELIAGIDTAVRRGRSVINMSWDGTRDDPLLDYELLLAFGTGSVLVAAAGNEFDEGNPIEFPASLNHVLTVASTDQASRPSYFSNSNDAVDLAAPGEGITVAVPYSYNPNGFDLYDGTSFSAPMVAAATAGVWSARTELDNTQMFDLMRYSAHDLGRAGFDPDTGYGLLDIQAALSQAAPGPDPSEPNEDIYMVKAGELFSDAAVPLTRPGHGRATIPARLDYTEDPEDVYRVWVPAQRTISVRVVGDANVDLELWTPGATSVYERGAAQKRDLIGFSDKKGTAPDTVAARNRTRRGRYFYADVFLGQDAGDAAYTLSVRTSSK